MKLSTVVEKLNNFAPPSIAEFDSVGFITKVKDKEVKKIGLTLDATLQTIKAAIDNNCDLLITHHGPLNERFNPKSPLDRKRILLAAKHDLPIFRMHLNLDFCSGGNSETLCKLLGFTKPQGASTIFRNHKLKTGAHIVEGSFSLEDLIRRVKKIHPNSVRVIKSQKDIFKKVAIAPGAGFEPEFLEQLSPIDAFISGELNHISITRAIDLNICLIEATHASTENEPLKKISGKIEKMLNIQLIFIESKDNMSVIKI